MPEVDIASFSVPGVKKKLFPLANIKNIRLFYWLTVFNNAWYISANWIFFWTRFMTFGQLGIVDGTAFAFGLLMEVPSGAISDLIGKRKTIIASMFFLAASVLTIATTSTMKVLWIAFFITQLGWALYSGAAEALAYDTLVERGKEEKYDEVISFSSSISSITTITATLIGGLLYATHFRLSHLAWGLTYLVGFLFSLSLAEPKIDTEKFSFSGYFKQLIDGVKQLLRPAIKPFLVVMLVLLGAEYLYSWGLVRPATAAGFGFLDKEQAIIFALFGILNAIIVRLTPKFRKYISDRKGLYLLSLIMGGGFLLAFLNLRYWGLIPMLMIALSGHLAYPWVSIVVNKEIPSRYRATTLSTVALITRIPYAVLAVVAGRMVELSKLNIFNLCVGMVVVFSILMSSTNYALRKIKKE